ncbi:hypothetical protein F7F58_00580 [Escherichia coli]|nr:hypothetical protein F7F58_00580 [Escherichia coli]
MPHGTSLPCLNSTFIQLMISFLVIFSSRYCLCPATDPPCDVRVLTIDDCWEGWAILLRQKQKKLIMLPSETMIWQPEFTDKTLSRKPGAVHSVVSLILCACSASRMARSMSESTVTGVFMVFWSC